jgi:hypothetical protein
MKVTYNPKERADSNNVAVEFTFMSQISLKYTQREIT